MNQLSRNLPLSLAFAGAASAVLADIPRGPFRIGLEPVASGMVAPNFVAHARDGSGRLFVVDQTGPIRVIRDGVLLPTPFLDLSNSIPPLNAGFDERGVLGMAFHPNYAQNGRFFVRYSRLRTSGPVAPCVGTSRGCHEEVLAEFTVSGDPDIANPTPRILFRIDEPEFNHNSGCVDFGPDGLLYFTLGDGGGANDGLQSPNVPHGVIGNGQNIETVLGSVLRINVDSAVIPYGIPPDNPFVSQPGVDEIYAYGFRNPFRFSFDDGPGGDGRLLVADVGQGVFEELNVVINGGNYGWAIREGAHCFDPFNPNTPLPDCDTTDLIDPIAEYTHAEGGLSIIGGYVYRGARNPALVGTYITGDFGSSFGQPSGRLYHLADVGQGVVDFQEFTIGPDVPYGLFLKGFGRDQDGEIYVCGSAAAGPNGATGAVERIVLVRLGDLNCDGAATVADIGAFVLALTDPAGFAKQFPGCTLLNGDFNGDSALTVSDIGLFVALLTDQ